MATRAKRKDALPRRPQSPLVELGGVALVEFHLCRRGMDCVRTQGRSARGDIWADTPIGRISIEVKTTGKSNGWFVKRRQYRAEIYCLVHLESARCWVMTGDEIDALLTTAADIYVDNVARIMATDLPKESLEAWDKIGGLRMVTVYRAFGVRPNKPYRSDRVVKKTLRDGTVKVYRYPRYIKTSDAVE